MTSTRAHYLTLTAIVALLIAGALAWRNWPPPAPAEPLTIAVAVNAIGAPLLVADRQGFLAAEGLRATLRDYPTGKLAMEAMLRGEADVATVAEAPIMFAGFKGAPLRVIANFASSSDHVRETAEQRARRAAEAALRESEEKYRILASYSPNWEDWRAPDCRYLYVSPACLDISGYAPSDFLADAGLMDKIIHQDDRDAWRAHWSNPASADAEPLIFRILTRDGGERWIEHICKPVLDDAGRFLGRRGSNRDITDRHLAEEKLDYAIHRDHLTGLPQPLAVSGAAGARDRAGRGQPWSVRAPVPRPRQLQDRQREPRP